MLDDQQILSQDHVGMIIARQQAINMPRYHIKDSLLLVSIIELIPQWSQRLLSLGRG